MISSEVQRTLVKSPPELWAELSDPDALARQLGELGDIRITHTEPELAVEWEAQDTSGTVLLKASGWGTKVTLTVIKEIPVAAPETTELESSAVEATPTGPEPAAVPAAERPTEIETEPPPTLVGEPSPDADYEPPVQAGAETAPETAAAKEPRAEPVLHAEPELTAQAVEPQPQPEARGGFFSRLFRRSPRSTPAKLERNELPDLSAPLATHPGMTAEPHLPEPVWAVTVPDPLDRPMPVATPESLRAPTAPPQPPVEPARLEELLGLPEDVGATETDEPRLDAPSTDEEPSEIAADLKAAEEVAAEQVTAVLTGVLDRLGAAHHRPFSRS
jgi:hypothetical protein